MLTEGLSEENRALVKRIGCDGESINGAIRLFPAALNRLLDAARAEGPAPPGGGGEEDYRGSLRSAPGSTSHRTNGAGECSKAAADDTECPACALAIDAEQCGSAHCWKLRRCPACGAPVALFITNPQAEAARRIGCSECDWIEQQPRSDGLRS